jgi:hypothetical protein
MTLAFCFTGGLSFFIESAVIDTKNAVFRPKI